LENAFWTLISLPCIVVVNYLLLKVVRAAVKNPETEEIGAGLTMTTIVPRARQGGNLRFCDEGLGKTAHDVTKRYEQWKWTS